MFKLPSHFLGRRCWTSFLIAPHSLPVCSTPGLLQSTPTVVTVTKTCLHVMCHEEHICFLTALRILLTFFSATREKCMLVYKSCMENVISAVWHFCFSKLFDNLHAKCVSWLRLTHDHLMFAGDGEKANKQVFIKAGPVCDLTVCQKSIYLAEQGGRSWPGLKNWVSGRLSPSALSQLGMRVLHHPTRSVTPAGQPGGKSNGVSCSPQAPSLWRLLWFHLTHQLHMNREGALWWLHVIKAIITIKNMYLYVVL